MRILTTALLSGLVVSCAVIQTDGIVLPYAVTHKNGHRVILVHKSSDPWAIEQICGRQSLACAIVYEHNKNVIPKHECWVYGPVPTNDIEWSIWGHEEDHCKGNYHPPT